MKQMEFRIFRGHHIRDLYLEYITQGELTARYGEGIITYPILVVDSVDDFCKEICKEYPAINFCRGPQMRNEDHKAARILGIKIGKKYDAETLIEIFKMKAKEQKMEIGKHYTWSTFIDKFYVKTK